MKKDGGPTDEDRAMMEALSRAVEAEVEAGNASELSAATPEAEPDPSPGPAPRPSPSPDPGPAPRPSAEVDVFAPPDASEAVKALDIDHGAVARSTAPRAAERISIARQSVAVVAEPRGGGAGKWIVALLLLA